MAHLRTIRLAAAVLVVLAAAPRAWAQSFNLDFGADPATLPPPSYAGAADQPGHWNASTGFDEPIKVVDVDGRPTEVVLECDLPFGPASFDDPGTTGGDESLLDDYLDLHSVPARLTIRGLLPGRYAIYTYAFSPDQPAFTTLVSPFGNDGQAVTGAWPGSLQQGVTHALHLVSPRAGSIELQLFGLPKGSLGGLQVVRLHPARRSVQGVTPPASAEEAAPAPARLRRR